MIFKNRTALAGIASGIALAAQLTVPSSALAQQASAPAAAPASQQPAQSQPADQQAPASPAAASTSQPEAAQQAPQQGAPAAQQPAPQLGFPGPAAQPAASTPSLWGTLFALVLVLALLLGLAWFMKRFGPRGLGGSTNMRVVGALNLGGRERILVVEVAGQWIVVGAAPGRVNLLTTMPKQEGAEPVQGFAGSVPSGFADWLKQTIDKRNAK